MLKCHTHTHTDVRPKLYTVTENKYWTLIQVTAWGKTWCFIKLWSTCIKLTKFSRRRIPPPVNMFLILLTLSNMWATDCSQPCYRTESHSVYQLPNYTQNTAVATPQVSATIILILATGHSLQPVTSLFRSQSSLSSKYPLSKKHFYQNSVCILGTHHKSQ